MLHVSTHLRCCSSSSSSTGLFHYSSCSSSSVMEACLLACCKSDGEVYYWMLDDVMVLQVCKDVARVVAYAGLTTCALTSAMEASLLMKKTSLSSSIPLLAAGC